MSPAKGLPPSMHHEDLEMALVECIRILARRGREIRGQQAADGTEAGNETEATSADEDPASAAAS